jgi:hypothetical protein
MMLWTAPHPASECHDVVASIWRETSGIEGKADLSLTRVYCRF